MFGITAFSQSPFSALGGNVYNQDVAESISLADSQAVVLVQPVSYSEAITLGDSFAVTQGVAVAINEGASAVDTLAVTQIRVATNAETMAVADTVDGLSGKFVDISESITTVSTFNSPNNIFNVAIAESQNPDDIVSTGLQLFEEQDESMAVADSLAVIQTVAAAISEAIANTDAYVPTNDAVAAIDEDTHADDVYSPQLNATSAIAESTTPTDAPSNVNVLSLFISDTMTPAATQAAVINMSRIIVESTAVADNMTYTVDTKALPTGVLITINITNVNVWGNIDDDGNPNWVVIND